MSTTLLVVIDEALPMLERLRIELLNTEATSLNRRSLDTAYASTLRTIESLRSLSSTNENDCCVNRRTNR